MELNESDWVGEPFRLVSLFVHSSRLRSLTPSLLSALSLLPPAPLSRSLAALPVESRKSPSTAGSASQPAQFYAAHHQPTSTPSFSPQHLRRPPSRRTDDNNDSRNQDKGTSTATNHRFSQLIPSDQQPGTPCESEITSSDKNNVHRPSYFLAISTDRYPHHPSTPLIPSSNHSTSLDTNRKPRPLKRRNLLETKNDLQLPRLLLPGYRPRKLVLGISQRSNDRLRSFETIFRYWIDVGEIYQRDWIEWRVEWRRGDGRTEG